MQAEFGSINVATIGTAVQFSATVKHNVRWIRIKARAGNSGVVYIGGPDDASSSDGYELSADESLEIEFPYQDEGTLSDFWADAATANDKVDFVAVTRELSRSP